MRKRTVGALAGVVTGVILLFGTNVPGAFAAWYLEWNPSTMYADNVTPIPAGKIVTYRAWQDNALIADGITGTSVLLTNVGVGTPHVLEMDAKVDNVTSPAKARLDWTSPLVGPAANGLRAVQR
jgi:hypothetical protein